jgi:hypothetical protein
MSTVLTLRLILNFILLPFMVTIFMRLPDILYLADGYDAHKYTPQVFVE